MQPVPSPTTAVLFDGLEASNIRLDKVWSGVKEVVARHLPEMVALYNQKNRLGGTAKLTTPAHFYTGGVDLQDKPLPAIVVGSEMEFGPLGPGAQLGTASTCIWVVSKGKITHSAARDASLLAHFCYGIMLGYQWGYTNALGQHLWAGLSPSGVRSVPTTDKGFGGFYLALDVVQGPAPGATSLYTSAETDE
jgi:hypothetical protein